MKQTELSDLNILLTTEYGSTAWGMARPDSDVDIFAMFAVDPRKLLDGTHSEAQRSHRAREVDYSHDGPVKDKVVAHEAANVVHLLLDGNINALTNVLSPKVHYMSVEALMLRDIVRDNLSKNIFASTNGMNAHNVKRYLRRSDTEGEVLTEKKSGQIMRAVQFATRILEGGTPEFKPVFGATFDDCVKALDDLKTAYDNSNLPERPDEAPYREWLYNLRMNELLRHA